MNRLTCLVALSGLISARALAQAAQPTAGENPLQLAPHHVTVSVADLDKETDWYQRMLGFRLVRSLPTGEQEVRQMAIPGYGIDLLWQKGSVRQHATTGSFTQGWLHVVFETPLIEAAYQRLRDVGTDVTAERTPQGTVSRLMVHDAEGNEIEIFARRPPQSNSQ